MAEALIGVAAAEKARRDLTEFAMRCVHGFQRTRHGEFICELLERVERGEIKRLILSAPPGHGKSTDVQAFCGWFLGRVPRRRVLMISASENLARRNSRAVRDIVTGDAFPFAKSAGELSTEALAEWELANGSGVRSVGVGGVITGFRVELIVLDDVQSERGSSVTRDTLETWWREVASTRLEPGGVVVAIMTRWGTDDFCARLLEGDDGEQWLHVNLPAYSLGADVDPLGRAFDEPLWPEKWTAEQLEQKRAEVGSVAFASQYMGDPQPEGGSLFKRADFGQFYDRIPTEMVWTDEDRREYSSLHLIDPPTRRWVKPVYRVLSIDAAQKTGAHNDYSAFVVLVTDGPNCYLEHVHRERLEFPQLIHKTVELFREFRPNMVLVEDASSGSPLAQALRQHTQLPILPRSAKGTKVDRAEKILPTVESKRIILPRHAPWLQAFLDEMFAFPGGRHDDQVDAFVMGLTWLWGLLNQRARYEHNAEALQNFMER